MAKDLVITDEKLIRDAISAQVEYLGFSAGDKLEITITSYPRGCYLAGNLVFEETPELTLQEAFEQWCDKVKIAPF